MAISFIMTETLILCYTVGSIHKDQNEVNIYYLVHLEGQPKKNDNRQ